ncbi:MAG: flagellar basal body L-ring protein FlgH [Planctomycetaceae bacterium]|nr:flagellar basal body L-ring protein FlgH [Planctomycetaceae bacterium]
MNRRKLGAALLGSLLLGSLLPSSMADSLWKRRSPRRCYLVDDSRAKRPGDLLTIIVSEATTVSNREGKGLSKETSANGVFNLAAASGGGFGVSAADASLDFSKSTGRTFDGAANYQNSQRFTDRVTVTVTGLTSQGDLIVEGTRNIQIAGEFRTLHVAGIVRAIDIGPDNQVSSQLVANMSAVYESRGPERAFTRQGWLGRGMNKIWPF